MPGMRDKSRLFQTWLAAALALIASPILAQYHAGTRYPIVEADIVRELSVVGTRVDAAQVHLAAYMTATTASPALEITTAEPLGSNHVRLEIRCAMVGKCLPFSATIDVKDASLVSEEIQSKTSLATAKHDTKSTIGESLAAPPKLTVGSHAVLTIRDGHLDIHLRVLAIDSGAIGQQVRVCTLDRKKVFHATVTGDETVTGAME